ncbi:hypothetical protein J6590_045982 [Homalodisca vitripennis]|nr:hypothetical protein J6590_045982 [Homalodisca vitripennis]
MVEPTDGHQRQRQCRNSVPQLALGAAVLFRCLPPAIYLINSTVQKFESTDTRDSGSVVTPCPSWPSVRRYCFGACRLQSI